MDSDGLRHKEILKLCLKPIHCLFGIHRVTNEDTDILFDIVNSLQHNLLRIITKYQQFILCMCKLLVFRRVRRIAKGDYYFHYVPLYICLSVCPSRPPSFRMEPPG